MERVLNKAIMAAMRTRALLEEPELFENCTNERLAELLTVIHNVLHTRGVRVDIQEMLEEQPSRSRRLLSELGMA